MKLNLSKEIYHGFDRSYIDGTRMLKESNDSCSRPTRNPFWKQPKDVYTGVKTRSQTKKSTIASCYYMDFYFDQIQNKNDTNYALTLDHFVVIINNKRFFLRIWFSNIFFP